jgi:hypothetical protein
MIGPEPDLVWAARGDVAARLLEDAESAQDRDEDRRAHDRHHPGHDRRAPDPELNRQIQYTARRSEPRSRSRARGFAPAPFRSRPRPGLGVGAATAGATGAGGLGEVLSSLAGRAAASTPSGRSWMGSGIFLTRGASGLGASSAISSSIPRFDPSEARATVIRRHASASDKCSTSVTTSASTRRDCPSSSDNRRSRASSDSHVTDAPGRLARASFDHPVRRGVA